jgi:hypothetical protein
MKSSSFSFSVALVNTSERSLYVLILKMHILKIKKIVLVDNLSKYNKLSLKKKKYDKKK